ncbi:MAG: BON domain-containing protein [Pirellulaceae bacterium]
MYPTWLQANNHELKDRIVRFLRQQGIEDTIRVHVDRGVATISGWHSTARDHDRCLDCCRHVAGVVRIVDASAVLRRDVPQEPLDDLGEVMESKSCLRTPAPVEPVPITLGN